MYFGGWRILFFIPVISEQHTFIILTHYQSITPEQICRYVWWWRRLDKIRGLYKKQQSSQCPVFIAREIFFVDQIQRWEVEWWQLRAQRSPLVPPQCWQGGLCHQILSCKKNTREDFPQIVWYLIFKDVSTRGSPRACSNVPWRQLQVKSCV